MVLTETGMIIASDNETTVTLSLATFFSFPTFMFLPTKFFHLIPKTWKIALVFLEHNFDLDTCGVRPKTLDLNSIYFGLCNPSLSCEKPCGQMIPQSSCGWQI